MASRYLATVSTVILSTFQGITVEQDSQLLSGTGPGAVDFAERITHIWTNTKAYLVAIQLAGPAAASGFGAAKSTVMQQFALVIP